MTSSFFPSFHHPRRSATATAKIVAAQLCSQPREKHREGQEAQGLCCHEVLPCAGSCDITGGSVVVAHTVSRFLWDLPFPPLQQPLGKIPGFQLLGYEALGWPLDAALSPPAPTSCSKELEMGRSFSPPALPGPFVFCVLKCGRRVGGREERGRVSALSRCTVVHPGSHGGC